MFADSLERSFFSFACSLDAFLWGVERCCLRELNSSPLSFAPHEWQGVQSCYLVLMLLLVFDIDIDSDSDADAAAVVAIFADKSRVRLLFDARCSMLLLLALLLLLLPLLLLRTALDGAFFGTSFAHLFFITFDKLVPEPSRETYTPLIFGFKIHK